MNIVCLLDTETSGLDPAKDKCIEVAVVRYSILHACVLESLSMLFESVDNEAEAINHIPAGALVYGYPAGEVWNRVADVVEGSDAIVAHNAAFDRRWVPAHVTEGIPWICTFQGITWPRTGDARNLVAIALSHGLGVVDPHRALADCMLIARLLQRCSELGHDVSAMLAMGLRASAHFQALVSFDQKDLAKAKGFTWEPKGRRWVRTMAIEDATEELLGFKVKKVAESIDV